MKKFLSNVSGVLHKIITKFKSLFNKNRKNYQTHSRGGRRKPATAVETQTPVLGAPGSAKVKPVNVASRSGRAHAARKGNVVTAFFWKLVDFFKTKRLANKKRFSVIMGVAAAAVLVPVIVASANGGMDNSAKAATGDEAAIVEPQAQGDGSAAGTEGSDGASADGQAGTATVDEPVLVEWTEDIASEPTATPEPEPQYLSLEPETTHPDVAKLQKRLMELNYMDNDEPTEYYGPVTQQAVGYFQRKHELDIDGVAGVVTQELLFSEDAKPYSVTVGAEGPDVSGIQQRLDDLGYNVGVTGYFGTETEAGVKYFQRMNGLDADGSVGQYTKELLYSDEAEPSEEYNRKPSSSSGSGSSGSKGSSSSGGGGGGSTSYSANPGSVESFISAAMAQQGKPYVRGGKGPDSFDCSGFVYYALQQSGNGIGYMTSGGWASSGYPTIGSLGELQRGDVICFSGHVGIYLGGGTMIDASSSSGAIVVRSCTGSWSVNNFICGKRPL